MADTRSPDTRFAKASMVPYYKPPSPTRNRPQYQAHLDETSADESSSDEPLATSDPGYYLRLINDMAGIDASDEEQHVQDFKVSARMPPCLESTATQANEIVHWCLEHGSHRPFVHAARAFGPEGFRELELELRDPTNVGFLGEVLPYCPHLSGIEFDNLHLRLADAKSFASGLKLHDGLHWLNLHLVESEPGAMEALLDEGLSVNRGLQSLRIQWNAVATSPGWMPNLFAAIKMHRSVMDLELKLPWTREDVADLTLALRDHLTITSLSIANASSRDLVPLLRALCLDSDGPRSGACMRRWAARSAQTKLSLKPGWPAAAVDSLSTATSAETRLANLTGLTLDGLSVSMGDEGPFAEFLVSILKGKNCRLRELHFTNASSNAPYAKALVAGVVLNDSLTELTTPGGMFTQSEQDTIDSRLSSNRNRLATIEGTPDPAAFA